MSDVRRLAAATLVATLSLVGVSSCQGDAPTPSGTPSAASTPLSLFSTEALSIVRDAFCSRIGPEQVTEALASPVDASASYNNGERAHVVDGVRDVAHEFDCTWRGRDGTVARAWVFAPPVTPGQARRLVRTAASGAGPGCTDLPAAPRFGAPSVAVQCRDDDRIEASFHGLFGDAWLSCSLEAPAADADQGELLDRAGRWCVTVASAAAADPSGSPSPSPSSS